MGKFCNTHVGERSTKELKDRLEDLKKRDNLGPGLKDEKLRIERVLARRPENE